MSVRVRYAPSPTGLQHIGGVRTAVFNYFFARANKGSFILRVEDTDRERYSDESLEDLYSTLNWLGIDWDEGPGKGEYGPYTQSERFDIYTEYAQKLLKDGKAYRCFCTSERLDALREEQKKTKKDIGYDRHCRDLSEEEIKEKLDSGTPYVLRLRVPLEGKVTFHDEVMGDISRKNKDVNPDPVIVKTDGFPTYHLANVIDDHLMKITHILRAQEWIPSTPLHVLLYEAFGWEPPKYCHLPMVMGKDGSKLSKRHGSTAVRDFKSAGYLPEAITNYISLLGWSYDDSREFFSKEDLKELFSLDRLNKSPSVFDYRKLDWFNGQYIRKKDPEELKAMILPLLAEAGIIQNPATDEEMAILEGALPLIHERLKLINDAVPMLRFLFQDVTVENPEDAIPKKTDAATVVEILERMPELLTSFEGKSEEEKEQAFVKMAEDNGWKTGQVMQPVRVGVTGSKISPPLIPAIDLLGLDKTLKRLERLKKQLQTGY